MVCRRASPPRISEFQHAAGGTDLTAIGAVLSGTAKGCSHREDITIFDSFGLSLQDAFMGEAILATAG